METIFNDSKITAAFIALFGVLLGGVLTFLLTWFKDSKIEQQKQKEDEKKLRREKLEELYILFNKWSKVFSSQGINLLAVMNHKIDYNQYLDLIIEEAEKRKYDFSRLEMILYIYASDLSVEYQNILSERDKLNKIESDYKQEYTESNMYTKKYIEPYTEALISIQNSFDELNNKIVKEIREI